MIDIDYTQRVNFSLCHAGIEPVIQSIQVPPGLRARLRISGYSQEIPLANGRTGPFSPPLDAHMFARLTAPVETRIVIDVEGREPELHPVLVSPLSAWGQRSEHALATAAFVLEDDPVIARFVQEAGMEAERLYLRMATFFGPCYLFERMLFPPDEQSVRFPIQMKYDLGGTCIDLSLAYAAALRRSGIDPLLVLLDDERGSRHALVGMWLAPLPGRRRPLPDPGLLLRALREGLWVPVEVTAATRGCSWAEARSLAREQIEKNRIEWVVDVAAARETGIYPLPGRPCMTAFNHWETRSLDERTKSMTGAAADALRNLSVEVLESGRPEEVGRKWEIHGFRAGIGKGFQHDVPLFEPTVSDPHAVIFNDGSEVRVKDLLSKNGTWVDGRRLPPGESCPLQPGQIFQVAKVKLRLSHGSERR